MKITCELCGGELHMNLGGQGATCAVCGLSYPMERLREMLAARTAVNTGAPAVQQPADITPVAQVPAYQPDENPQPVIPQAVPAVPVVQAPEDQQNGAVEPVAEIDSHDAPEKPNSFFDFKPKQFVMKCYSFSGDKIKGTVVSGCIAVGEFVYINGNYKKAYKVCGIKDSLDDTYIKEGMKGSLYLEDCPRRICRNAATVTGEDKPVVNAYSYPHGINQYFNDLIKSSFNAYDFEYDVRIYELKTIVDFMFLKDGKPVLAVLLEDSKSGNARVAIKKATEYFADKGIAFLHFYSDYRNDAPYVIKKIRGALGE